MNKYQTPVEQPPEPKDEKKWRWYNYVGEFFGFIMFYILLCLAWAGFVPILEQQGVTVPRQLDMRQAIQEAIDWLKG